MLHTSPLDRGIILTLGGVQSFALLIGGVALLLAGISLAWLAVMLAFLALLAAILAVAFLYFRYRRLPGYKKKRELQAQLRRVQLEVGKAAGQVYQAQRIRQGIRQEEREATIQRQAAHRQAVERIEQRRGLAVEEEQKELFTALQQIQTAHMENGLRAASIREARIPGIGPKFKERLIANGIANALHVQAARIAALQGFGQAKVDALSAWRRSLETAVRVTLPRKLPEAQATRIQAASDRLRQQLAEQETQAHAALESDLASLSRQAAKRQARNDAAEAGARQRAQGLQRARKGIQKSLAPYAGVTFFNYLKASAGGGGARSRLSSWGIAGGVLILMAVCPLLQAGLGATSSVAWIVASIPTATITPTPTLTHRPSFTPTPSLTSTVTLTLTGTSTPTHTLAPAITFTSTITPTQAPSVPDLVAPSCMPRETLRQSGRVVEVIDGDTIDVILEDGQTYRVRYIGIDSPEREQPHSREAANRNRQLVGSADVVLVKDVSETDQYDRLLRYVFAGDVFVNYVLVREGLAWGANYPPDVACKELFANAEKDAQSDGIGIWASTPSLPPREDGPCNCSRDYDCDNFSSHEEAQTCFESCGGSPSYNWSRLDADHDGIACESLP